MCEGYDLHKQRQIIGTPAKVFVFEHISHRFRVDLPHIVAHLAVQPQNGLQTLGEATLSQPFRISSCPEEPSKVSSHHIGRALFSRSCKGNKEGNLVVQPISLQQSHLSENVFLQVAGVKEKKTFEIGDEAVSSEELIEQGAEVFGKRRDVKYFSTALAPRSLTHHCHIRKAFLAVKR